jgi:hypothetical protein
MCTRTHARGVKSVDHNCWRVHKLQGGRQVVTAVMPTFTHQTSLQVCQRSHTKPGCRTVNNYTHNLTAVVSRLHAKPNCRSANVYTQRLITGVPMYTSKLTPVVPTIGYCNIERKYRIKLMKSIKKRPES